MGYDGIIFPATKPTKDLKTNDARKDVTCEGQRGQISRCDFADGRVGSKTMAARSSGAILRRCSGIWKRIRTTCFLSHISLNTLTGSLSVVVIIWVGVDFRVSWPNF